VTKKHTNKNQAKATKVMEVGKKLADALKQAPTTNGKGKVPAAPPAPAAKGKGKQTSAAKQPPAADKANSTAFALHVNKTGRLCFGKDAAKRLTDYLPNGFMSIAVTDGNIQLEPSNKKAEGMVDIRDGGGRPYISAAKQMKPLGFDGSRAYDCIARPFGAAGFEFRLA
jgi:hypothetical protein